MRKYLAVLALAFICAGVFWGPDGLGRWFSFYLSQKYGIIVRAERIRWPQKGHIEFSSLKISDAASGAGWLEAQKGFLSIEKKDLGPGGIRVRLEGITLLGSLKNKYPEIAMDHAVGVFYERSGFHVVRIFEAQSRDLRLAGASRFKDGQLRKLSAHMALSPRLAERLGKKFEKSLPLTGEGKRAACLSFGGATWTLRGSHGPLLQFSGRLGPNNN